MADSEAPVGLDPLVVSTTFVPGLDAALPVNTKPEDVYDGRCFALMTSYDAPGLHKRCTQATQSWPELFCLRFHGCPEARMKVGTTWWHSPTCTRCHRQDPRKRPKVVDASSDDDESDAKRPKPKTEPKSAKRAAVDGASDPTRSRPSPGLAIPVRPIVARPKSVGELAVCPATMWPPVVVPPEQSKHTPGRCGIFARLRLPRSLRPPAWGSEPPPFKSCLASGPHNGLVALGKSDSDGGEGAPKRMTRTSSVGSLSEGSGLGLAPPTSPQHPLSSPSVVTPIARPPASPMPDAHALLERSQILACSINLEAAPVEGDSWLTGSLIDFVSFHFAQHFPDVHYLPTNFAALDLPNAVRHPESLKDFDARDILGRKVTVRPENVDLMIETMRSEIVVPPSPVSVPPSPPLPPASTPIKDPTIDAIAPSIAPVPVVPTVTVPTTGPSPAGPSSTPVAAEASNSSKSSVPVFPGTCARTRPVVRVSVNPIRVLPVASLGSRPSAVPPVYRPPLLVASSTYPHTYVLQQQQQPSLLLQQRWGPSLRPGTDPATVYALISTYGPVVASQVLRQQQQQHQHMLAVARAASGPEMPVNPHVRPQILLPVLPPTLPAATTSVRPQVVPGTSSSAPIVPTKEEAKPALAAAAVGDTSAGKFSNTPSSGQSGPVSPLLPMQRAVPVKKVVFDARAEYQRPLLFFWNIGNMHWNFFRIRLGLRKEIELFEPMGRPQSRSGQEGVSLRSLPHALIVWLDQCYPVEGGWLRLAKSAIKYRHQLTGFDCGVACLLYAEKCGQGMSRQDIEESTDQADITEYRKLLQKFLAGVR